MQGVEYPLQDAELTSRYPLGVSNEWTAPRAELSFTAGALTLLYAKDAPCVSFDKKRQDLHFPLERRKLFC